MKINVSQKKTIFALPVLTHLFADHYQWIRYPNKGIYGYDDNVITTETEGECLKACMNETAFQCLSVDYNKEGVYEASTWKKCFKGHSNKDMVPPGNFLDYNRWIHFQRGTQSKLFIFIYVSNDVYSLSLCGSIIVEY